MKTVKNKEETQPTVKGINQTEVILFNKMLEKRVVMVTGEVNKEMSDRVIQQLLCLAVQDPEKDITLLINSPGGHVTEGLAIHDVMEAIPCDVSTICMGMAASMGSFLLASGTKGKRFSFPNSEIMIHQVLGGIQGKVTDMAIQAKMLKRTKIKLNKMLSNYTGQSIEKIEEDTDRDNFLTADQAAEYGLIDGVITKLPFF